MYHVGEPVTHENKTGQRRGRVSNDTTPANVYIFQFYDVFCSAPPRPSICRDRRSKCLPAQHILRSAPSGRTLKLSRRRWYMQVSGDKKMSQRSSKNKISVGHTGYGATQEIHREIYKLSCRPKKGGFIYLAQTRAY